MNKRIFVIHPTAMSMPPIATAFARNWPEARVFNLLEESLYDELDPNGTITPVIRRRVALLLAYCVEARADAVLFNGTTFGPAIDEARANLPVPVVKSTEAMAEEAVAAGSRIALLCTSKRSLPVIAATIEAAAKDAGRTVEISRSWVPDAQAAMAAGHSEIHNRLVAAAANAIGDCDVLVLGQVPMIFAEPLIPMRPGRVVMSGPASTVFRLRRLLVPRSA